MITRLEYASPEGAMNLAIDEAMLEEAEAGEAGERLRLWEFPVLTAVVGRGSRIAGEVDLDYCTAHGIDILRRCSGGAAIVAGPGCLMYSLVLDLRRRPELRRLDAAHHFVMGALAAAIQPFLAEVQVQGTCDLTWRNRKFSGNSVRVARDHMLYHGTLLYGADLERVSRALTMPPRRPEYRQDRDHRSFLANVPLDRDQLRAAAIAAFAADQADPSCPIERAERLADERYRRTGWTHRH